MSPWGTEDTSPYHKVCILDLFLTIVIASQVVKVQTAVTLHNSSTYSATTYIQEKFVIKIYSMDIVMYIHRELFLLIERGILMRFGNVLTSFSEVPQRWHVLHSMHCQR